MFLDHERFQAGHVGIHRDVVFGEVRVDDPAGTGVADGLFVKRKRDAPDHPAKDLAADHARIDHTTGRERADKAGDPDLTEIGIDLDLGENGAVRVHGIGRLRGGVGGGLAAGVDLAQPGAAKDIRVALAAVFIVAAEQAAIARGNAGIAGAEQR